MTRALISVRAGETRTAVYDDDRLADLLIQREDKPELVGSRYLGRVTAFDTGLQAAFVDIGLERPAVLPKPSAPGRLVEGGSVMVEIVRAPSAGKGAKLTARLPDPPEAQGKPPRLLQAANPLAELLRRHDPDEIVVEALGEGALAGIKRSLGAFSARVRASPAGRSLFEEEAIEAEIEALLDPEVPLPGGGLLRIEPVTTLTAVDVDARGHDARGGAGRLALEVDLAAARELARQLRLRALSGLIVVDFLELPTKAERTKITDTLRTALEGDPVATDIGAMRPSGLVEIARRRARLPLHEVLSEPCGRGGSGRIKDVATVAYELLRAVEREAWARPGAEVTGTACLDVVAALDGVVRPAREEVERRLGGPLRLRADPACPRESYEILVK